MEIQKTLVLSTGHLPYEEFKELKDLSSMRYKNLPFRAISHEYGVILIFEEFDDSTKFDFENMYNKFPVLSKIYSLMQANKITRVDFDQDGQTDEFLKIFDW